MSNGTVCSPEEYTLSFPSDDNPYPHIYCLTRGQSIGLALTAEAGFISLVAVLLLLALVIRNVHRYWRLYPSGKWRLLQEPMDIYMLNLLFFDLLQALGAVFDVKWVNVGKVFTGTLCTTQGVTQQLGETGVAMTTLAITVHTFVTVFWRVGVHSRAVAYGVVGFIWLYVALFVGISAGIHRSGEDTYDVPTPYWCWVGEKYGSERIAGEYLWLWITLFTSVIMYVPLYFWSQGNLSVDTHTWWRFRVHRRQQHIQDVDGRQRRAFGMLAYPLVYSVLVLPLSIVRWISFSSGSVPSVATFIVIFIYSLSGASNVLLLLLTRPQLLLFTPPPRSAPAGGRTLSPAPSPLRARIGGKSDAGPARLGVDDEGDGGWNLPSGRSSIISSYVGSELP